MRGRGLWMVIAWSVLAAIILERQAPDTGLTATVAAASLIGLLLTVASVLCGVLWRALAEPAPMLSLPDGEQPVASTTARHTPASGRVPRGGRLFITTAALRFVPRPLSFDRDLALIPFSSITRVEAQGEHAVRIHTSTGSSLLVVDEAPLLALWLADLRRGDRGVRAVLDIAAFSSEPDDRCVLTVHAS
ncbi:MAG: hypothetical protein ACI8S6_002250 [Myxococcota bacterium]